MKKVGYSLSGSVDYVFQWVLVLYIIVCYIKCIGEGKKAVPAAIFFSEIDEIN